MRTIRRRAPGGTVRSVVVALCAAALTAGALTGVAHATPSTGALVGRVTLDGQGIAGATITLTNLLMEPVSTSYREEPIAVATSKVGGVFSLPLEVTQQVLDAARENSGYVNYVLYAFFGDGVAGSDPQELAFGAPGTAFTAGEFAYSQVVFAGTEEAVEDPIADVASYALATPDPVSLELTAVSTLGTATGSGGADNDDCDPYYAPYITKIGEEWPFQPIGEAHAAHDTWITFEYGTHANTDLGGGFSYGGGPWKASAGTSHMGNKNTIIRKPYDPGQKYKLETTFLYVKERLDFTDDDGDERICRTDYRIRALGWRGGYRFGEDVSRFDTHGQMDAARGKGWALYYGGKGDHYKKTARTRKFFKDVEAFGVQLHAQSTWSKQVDLQYVFGNEPDHWIYGNDGPPHAAGAIYGW